MSFEADPEPLAYVIAYFVGRYASFVTEANETAQTEAKIETVKAVKQRMPEWRQLSGGSAYDRDASSLKRIGELNTQMLEVARLHPKMFRMNMAKPFA